MKLTGAFVLLLLVTLGAARKTYSGYQVFRTAPLNEETIKKLAPLLGRPELDFWTQPRQGRPADIMTSPEHAKNLWNELKNLGLEPSVHIPDVERVVQEEDEAIAKVRSLEERNSRAVTFDRFMEFDEILAYMDEMVAAYPNLASLVELGSSYEGRPMRAIYISNGPGKNALFTDGAIHAREWIAPPVALKIIYELLENYDANKALLDMIDWYVLPVANPDGYSYSWSDERFWRKTRSPNPGSSCMGTDPNRNFDFHWGEEGVTSPCGETWPNTVPFSEPETKAMSDFLMNNKAITMYVAIHSYGQILIFPYGHTTELPPTFDELNANALEAAAALEAVRGTQYEVGTVANILYYSYGACRDWSYGVAGIPLSYTFELPDGGFGGFNPPPSDIIPVVTETWEGFKVLAEKASVSIRP